MDRAEAQVAAAQARVSYTQVRAPVAGRVGRIEVTVGNLVSAGAGASVDVAGFCQPHLCEL